ncbi:MAG: type II toxin-antitoxin system PemK/MazF family toxin, partial [Actinomycetes bacterium]
DVGTGDWDRQGRPSEARLDRIVRLRPESIRREGAVLDRARFEKVASGLRRRHGWN